MHTPAKVKTIAEFLQSLKVAETVTMICNNVRAEVGISALSAANLPLKVTALERLSDEGAARRREIKEKIEAVWLADYVSYNLGADTAIHTWRLLKVKD
ncbi:MAG: hypothetical protein V4469_05025 [Patescibacteria group bacterium]